MAEFFDKMIVGINKGASNLKEGSKNLIEKANINTAIHKAEDEKKKLAELMGFKAYELYKAGTPLAEELSGFCSEMEKRDEQIAKQQQSLAALENKGAAAQSESAKVCSCGYANRADSKFCAKCGTKLD